jgi:hypothetical protein
MPHWKTTLGGSLSAFGKALIGIGIVPQLGGLPSKVLTGIALAGFVIDAVGSFLGHLFAADAAQVASMATAVNANTKSISDAGLASPEFPATHYLPDAAGMPVLPAPPTPRSPQPPQLP